MIPNRRNKASDSEISELKNQLAEDDMVALLLREVEGADKDISAYARAFVEADGDEVRAKALYVKHRLRRISAAAKLTELLADAEASRIPPDLKQKMKDAVEARTVGQELRAFFDKEYQEKRKSVEQRINGASYSWVAFIDDKLNGNL